MPESKAVPRKSRADTGGEKVIEIPPAELHSFKNHPFKVKDDDSMMETADSIRQYGVLVPAIARPSPEAMSLSPDTAATGPVSWPRKRQCRLSSNISDYHGKLCIKSPISVAKKKVMVCYAMAFIIRFRFNAVDDKRHCCSAASNPLLYRNFKLCLAFCVAKLPSLHICRRSKTFACLSVPSFS